MKRDKRLGKIRISSPAYNTPDFVRKLIKLLKMTIVNEGDFDGYGIKVLYGKSKHFEKVENMSIVPEYTIKMRRIIKERSRLFCWIFRVPILKEKIILESVDRVK